MQFLLFFVFTTFTALISSEMNPYNFPTCYRINEHQADQVCDVQLLLNAMSFLIPFSKDKLRSADP